MSDIAENKAYGPETVNVVLVSADGARRTVAAAPGASLMEAATAAGHPGIEAACGGCCACATCHVYADLAALAVLPEPDEEEAEMLDEVAAERRATSRLSCQVIVTPALAGCVFETPEVQS